MENVPASEHRNGFDQLGSIIATMLEEGSARAARARTLEDAEALRLLGQDVSILAAAMTVLIRPAP